MTHRGSPSEARPLILRRPVVLTSMVVLTAALAGPALAQVAPTLSYNAPDPTVVSGHVTWDRGVTTPGVEVYTVGTETAVIDFTPSDTQGQGVINFQNLGTEARYVNDPSIGGYTILNRIVPTDASRPIQFNGTVISRLQTQAGSAAGGNVWFYSPGGIVVGADAAFDVGSLLLTARDPTAGSGEIGSTTSFLGGGDPGARIDIQAGASILASAEGSYVAIMAPAITQAGDVRVNGNVAYVAAEQSTLTINGGLFDIQVLVGTDTGNGFPIQHSGSTGGPASGGAADPHAIYMVAVPKNDAITILLNGTGQLGFDIAQGATVENGRVVLSAGRSIVGGQIAGGGPASLAEANVHISGGTVTSDLEARATTNAYAAATSGTAQFAGDVTLHGGQNAHIGARQNGVTMSIGGDVNLIVDQADAQDPNGGVTSTGGLAQLYTQNGGGLDIAGNVTLTADAQAVDDGFAATTTGGRAVVSANGGVISIGGDLTASGQAFGVFSYADGVGPTQGGQAVVLASNGGAVSIDGDVSLNASASGGVAAGPNLGLVTGGQAGVQSASTGGQITIGGDVSATADASGASGSSDGGSIGGDAQGGRAYVLAQGTGIDIGGSVQLSSGAVGGSGPYDHGGMATGGQAFVQATTGSNLDIDGDANINAQANGGYGGGGTGGGLGFGGRASLLSAGDLHIGGTATLDASGRGGQAFGSSGGGGDAHGGLATVSANQGSIVIDQNLNVYAQATGGSAQYTTPGNGGDADGGGARVQSLGADGALMVTGNLDMRADGDGGNGGSAPETTGGRGSGGYATAPQDQVFDYGLYLLADGGTLTITGASSLSAIGTGGQGATGGLGQGGLGYVEAYDGVLSLSNPLSAFVAGDGGDAILGATFGGGRGGDGEGGVLHVGTFAANGITGQVDAGDMYLAAEGTGGFGAAGFNGAGGEGGDGRGGSVYVIAEASAGAVSTGFLNIYVGAIGGDGGDGSNGAAGFGGGAGGTGFAGGDGGDAFGGVSIVGTSSGADLPGNTGSLNVDKLFVVTIGQGGDGGLGGTGGDGGSTTFPDQAGGAGGSGGDGGAGGQGVAGDATIQSRGALVSMGDADLYLLGVGGNGGAAGTGGIGGFGQAGQGQGGDDGITGAGGEAAGGYGALLVTNRFQRAERGQADLGSVSVTSQGLGGRSGDDASSGQAIAGGFTAQVISGDATLDNLSFAGIGETPRGASSVDVEVADGRLDVAGALSLVTSGDMALNVRDGGALHAGTASLSGNNLLPRADGGVVGEPGLIDIDNSLTLNFVNDIGVEAGVVQTGADGGVFIDAGGAVQAADIDAEGFVRITSRSIQGGDIAGYSGVQLDALGQDVPAGEGDVSVGDLSSEGGGVHAQAVSGQVNAGGVTANDFVELIGADGVTAGNLSGAQSVTVGASRGAVDVGTVDSGGLLDLSGAGNVHAGVLTGGRVQVAGGSVDLTDVSGDSVLVISQGDATVGDVRTGGQGPNAHNVVIAAGGDLTSGDIDSADSIALAARTGSVQTGDLNAGQSVMVVAGADFDLGAVSTGGTGTFYFGSSEVLEFSPAYDNVFTGQSSFFDDVALGGLTVIARSDTTFDSGAISARDIRGGAGTINLSAANASQSIYLMAQQKLVAGGAMTAPAIQVLAADIDIGQAGSIGNANTLILSLIDTGFGSPMHLGGTGSDSGFSLTAAEVGRLHARRVDIFGPSSDGGSGQIIIGQLNLVGSAGGQGANLIGDQASFNIHGGSIRVEGAVALTSAATTDILSLDATRRIEVATDHGGAIVLTGAGRDGGATTLAGELRLRAPVIAVADDDILGQMADDSRYEGIEDDLATNTGETRPEGYIQAGKLSFAVADILAIQNSGSRSLAAGFSAGSGGVTLTPYGAIGQLDPNGGRDTVAPIAHIWGRVENSAGGWFTNAETIEHVQFMTASQGDGDNISLAFDEDSTVNGCRVGASCNDDDQPGEIINQVEALEEVLAADPIDVIEIPSFSFVRLVDQAGLVVDPVITEPVSGAGNAGLWDSDDDDDDDDDQEAADGA